MLYPEIDPVAISIWKLDVYWYGLMYLCAFASAWLLGRWRANRPESGWTPQQMDDLIVFGGFGVVLGGRLGSVLFYNFDRFLNDPAMLLRIWEGGMSFHGGLIGVLVAMWLFGKRHDKTFFKVTDFVAPLVPLGLMFGRFGNFINGELWGAPSTVPWAMQVDCTQSRFYDVCQNKLGLSPDMLLSPPLHPSQLYQSLTEGLLLFLVLWWYSAKPQGLGAVSGLFLVGYAIARLCTEFVRMPDSHIGYLYGDWLTMGQTLSAPMLLFGLFLIWRAKVK